MSNPAEMVAHLGRMVRAERARLGYTSVEKAASAAGMKNYKTLSQFELGRTMPNAANRSLVEDLLMWRDGALTDALSKEPGDVTFEFVRDWEKEEPATAASELTDEALMTEVIKRMDGWRLKLARLDELEVLVREVGPSSVEGQQTPAQANHQRV